MSRYFITIGRYLFLALALSCNSKQQHSTKINTPIQTYSTMTPLEQLKSIVNEQYISEDGDPYKIVLKPGLTDTQIDNLTQQLPSGQIPGEIRELLRFASGFEFYGIDQVNFDDIGIFGFENIFPYTVQLVGDGFGNFWVLDIDSQGNWGAIFYVCHDPAVIVKHSENLTEFINHVHEFGKLGKESHLDIIHEQTVNKIWNENNGGFINISFAKNTLDTTLVNFVAQLPDNFVIADLRNKPNKAGFAWGKFGAGIDNAVRHKHDLLWGFEKKTKKGLLSKLFRR